MVDDELYHANPSMFGVDDEFKGDTAELTEESVHLTDPLDGFHPAQRVRTVYFEWWPMDRASDGIDDYVRFKTVSFDLVLLYALPRTPEGSCTRQGLNWRK